MATAHHRMTSVFDFDVFSAQALASERAPSKTANQRPSDVAGSLAPGGPRPQQRHRSRSQRARCDANANLCAPACTSAAMQATGLTYACTSMPAGLQASLLPAVHLGLTQDSISAHGACADADINDASSPAIANVACKVHLEPGWVPGAPHGEQPGHLPMCNLMSTLPFMMQPLTIGKFIPAF